MDRDQSPTSRVDQRAASSSDQAARSEPTYRTIFLSDLHLGSPDCQIADLTRLIESLSCEHLVLNGDIIDFWKMRRAGAWHASHLAAFHAMLRLMQQRGMQVTYVRGNHDDLTRCFEGLKIEGLQFVEQFVYHTAGKRYLVLHGDVFDAMVRRGGLPSWAADQAYNALLAINRAYNWQRRLMGREPFSIAAVIKRRLGSVMRFVERFEQCMVSVAKEQGCDGVICGHIHVPASTIIDGIHYLNSGDWVENCTAIVETHSGELRVATLAELAGPQAALVHRAQVSSNELADQNAAEPALA